MMKVTIKEVQKMGTDMLAEMVKICEENNLTYFGFYGTMLGAVRHNGPIPWDADIDILVPESEMDCFVETMNKYLPPEYWIHYRDDRTHPRCFARIGLTGYRTESFHIDVFRLIGFPDSKKKQRKMAIKGHILYVMWKAKCTDSDYYYRSRRGMRIKAKILRALLAPISVKKIIKQYDVLCQKYDYNCSKYVGNSIYPVNYIMEKTFFEKTIRIKYANMSLCVPAKYEEMLEQHYGNYMEFPPLEEREAQMNQVMNIRKL